MGYLDCIKPYQSVDLSNHLPFYIGQERVGWIQKPFIEHLKQFADIFICDETCVTLSDSLNNFDTRSAAVKKTLATLANQGVVKQSPFGPHNPSPAFQHVDWLPVGNKPFTHPLIKIERYYIYYFGAMLHNISIIGHTSDHVWLAQRSNKVTNPNKLDHLVSGSCTTQMDIGQTIIDEARDEAGLTDDLIKKIKPLSSYNLIHNKADKNVFSERANLFTVEIPKNFQPKTKYKDEVAGFKLISFDELNDEILNQNNLLDFSKIVFIQFLIKIGYITEKHKEYNDLTAVFNYNPSTDIAAY